MLIWAKKQRSKPFSTHGYAMHSALQACRAPIVRACAQDAAFARMAARHGWEVVVRIPARYRNIARAREHSRFPLPPPCRCQP